MQLIGAKKYKKRKFKTDSHWSESKEDKLEREDIGHGRVAVSTLAATQSKSEVGKKHLNGC